MTVKALQDVLDRTPTWSVERQEHAAELLAAIESDGEFDYTLSPEDLAEFQRRVDQPDPVLLSFEEVFSRPPR
jgi:hypothetical protein